MKLDRIEISGFRGIRRLSLTLDDLSVLIGENAWGKSSLLDALDMVLPPTGEFPPFNRSDFHIDHNFGDNRVNLLQIVLRWCETDQKEMTSAKYRRFCEVANINDQGFRYVDYCTSATFIDGKIETTRYFLDKNGDPHPVQHHDVLAAKFVRIHPAIRVRDARRLRSQDLDEHNGNGRLEKRLNNTCRRIMTIPGHVNDGEIRSGLNALRTLLDHYFAIQTHNRDKKMISRDRYKSLAQQNVHPLEQIVEGSANKRQGRLLLIGLLNAFIRARGPKKLSAIARPLVIFEDPEGRLHPTLLSQAWRIMRLIPMQKIITTNSGDLLNLVPLTSVRRLVRGPGNTEVYNMPPNRLSRDEERRVAFHVRIHRPSALFARCWLLVEGETEVWLFNELAKLSGYDLGAEGVHIIEFAQSGIKPLIKLAKSLGIEWHVVSDGDQAGQKYATTVRAQLNGAPERHHLTVLPSADIEHFLFDNGYEALFRDMAKVGHNIQMPPRKIIMKALKHFAKPDAALAIVEYTVEQGIDQVPVLLRWIVQRSVALARGGG